MKDGCTLNCSEMFLEFDILDMVPVMLGLFTLLLIVLVVDAAWIRLSIKRYIMSANIICPSVPCQMATGKASELDERQLEYD